MSAARSSMAGSRVSGPAAPTYEPMDYCLTSRAQRELALLIRQHNLKDLNEHIKHAQIALTDYAADINEKAYWKGHELKKQQRQADSRQRKKIKTQHDEEAPEVMSQTEADLVALKELEERNAEFRVKVQAMTRRMDDHIRKAIDGEQRMQELKESLEFTASNAVQNSQRVQQARSQAQTRAQEAEDEEDEDVTQITATGRSRAARDGEAPLGLEPTKTLREQMERSTIKYQSLSLSSRYSQHPSYVGFKQAVHDAQYDPEHIPDLPAARTWFNQPKGEPAPGTIAGDNEDDDDDDASDDDVAVLQAKISTKCPLTLVEFVNPVTSNQCRHSFERDAIMELIGRAIQRQHGRTGEKIVQCPVPGCNARIMASNLHQDVAILRKIQRIQEHQRRAADYEDEGRDRNGAGRSRAVNLDSDEEGVGRDGGDGAHDIDSLLSDDEGAARRRTVKRFKSEPRGTQGRGQSNMPVRSQAPNVVDLDGESTEDDDEEAHEDDETAES